MAALDPVYPVGLVVAGRRCLVVGGGRVAGAKDQVAPRVPGERDDGGARRLTRRWACSSADGTIAGIEDAPLDVQLRPYEPGEAAGYRLVVTATGIPGGRRPVAADAERAGVWVNSADDAANCTLPAPCGASPRTGHGRGVDLGFQPGAGGVAEEADRGLARAGYRGAGVAARRGSAPCPRTREIHRERRLGRAARRAAAGSRSPRARSKRRRRYFRAALLVTTMATGSATCGHRRARKWECWHSRLPWSAYCRCLIVIVTSGGGVNA